MFKGLHYSPLIIVIVAVDVESACALARAPTVTDHVCTDADPGIGLSDCWVSLQPSQFCTLGLTGLAKAWV
jgi:hypothetical protein